MSIPRRSSEVSLGFQAENLTPREREVLAALARGCTTREVAQMLGMSPNTAHSHTKNIYQKLGISSRSEAARAAVRLALIDV